jgi:hypothetical protein
MRTIQKIKLVNKIGKQVVGMPSAAVILDIALIDEGFCESSLELTVLGAFDAMSKETFIVAEEGSQVTTAIQYAGSVTIENGRALAGRSEKKRYIFRDIYER